MSKFGTKGDLVTCDMWLQEIPELDALEGLIEMAIIENKINVVNFLEHEFTPHGATLVWILSESHLVVHTYPEHKYISIDIYTCGEEGSAINCMEYIREALLVKTYKLNHYKRGI